MAGKRQLPFLGIALLAGLAGCSQALPTANEAVVNRTPAESIQEADRLYLGREDLTMVRQGLIVLRQASMKEGGNYDVAWRIARLDYYLGSHTADESERERAFREGVQAGKLAVQLADGKPEGHFWLGANYGGTAQDSTLAGLAEVGTIRREMETVIKLDERYQAGSAQMVMGQTYLEAPILLGGDRYKAVEYLEQSVKIGPTNALARLHLAEAYVAVNRKADALKVLEELSTMKPDPDFTPEHKDAVALGKKLQEKIKSEG